MRDPSKRRRSTASAAVTRDASEPEVEFEATLAERAYQAILKGLFERSIPVGTPLSQAELIRTLGITAQPLRDALRTLENEGLVVISARSGIRFIRADLELSRSTYQFRSLIERQGARSLAESGDAAMIATLADDHRALLDRLEQGSWGPDEEAMLGTLEERLHTALIAALRNPLIEITARRLKNYVTLVRLDWLTTRPLAIRTINEHLQILDACVARDADAAEAALVNHFQLALQRLIRMI